MKVYEIINEDGVIVQGVNTTVDVKPGETERQAKKFFGGNGKPKPLGVKGATPNQAYNLGLVEQEASKFYENISHTSKRLRDIEKERDVKIGSEDWFKLWFSLPYLKESVEDVRSFADQLEKKYELQTLFLSDLKERNAIEIASIIVGKENQKSGIGSAVMNEIIQYADQLGKTLVLTPGLYDKKHGTTSQSRLIKFYKRFGFVENKGRNKNYEFRHSMIRYPQNSESVIEAFDTDVEWVDGAAPRGASVYAAMVDDAYIEITYKPVNDGVYISFSRGGSMAVTGEGKQNKIFGAVINHIKKWVEANDPQKIYFSAYKPRTGPFGSQDNSRSILYQKMLQRFAKQNGYDFETEDTGNEDTFVLTKQVKDQTNEALDNPYPIRWSSKNKELWYGHAKEEKPYDQIGISIELLFPGVWDINFSVNDTKQKTGGGDQFKIFATVKEAIQQWWNWASKNTDVEKITFSAEKIADESRAKLYQRFAKQFADAIGYNLNVKSGTNYSTFNIEKPNVEETRSFQPLEKSIKEGRQGLQFKPMRNLIFAYGFFGTLGQLGAIEKGAKNSDSANELKKVIQELLKSTEKLNKLNDQDLERNKNAILHHIHDMMQYAIAHFREHFTPEFFEGKKSQINSVLKAYKKAASGVNENYVKKKSHLSEGYKMQLERADGMYILHILDTKTKQRTEVRGKSGYESGNYDENDRLHKLLDTIGKSANISELINGEVVTINPNHPDSSKAQTATTKAFNEKKSVASKRKGMI